MATQPGPIRRLWYSWKMMQLPWRRKWLVGFDLDGHTYWEFKDALHTHRTRRIVQYGWRTHHGDVNVPPQWMQWLRHTREDPPSLADQQAEVYRQGRMKMLAAQADARWASKPSVLDAPAKTQPPQMLQSSDPHSGIKQVDVAQEADSVAEETEQTSDAPTLKTRKPMRTEPKDSPWNQASKGNPGAEWQPASWSPGPTKRRA